MPHRTRPRHHQLRRPLLRDSVTVHEHAVDVAIRGTRRERDREFSAARLAVERGERQRLRGRNADDRHVRL